MSNFRFPYFSRNIGEFWRRWHISLSTWFRDYLYIPLGGSKEGKWKSIRNIFVIFIVSGFWHGANWTFIFWGLFHSVLFLPSFFFKTNRKYVSSVIAENTLLPNGKEFFQVLITFILVTIGWVFFRSETISDSFNFLTQLNFDFNFTFVNKLPLVILFIFLDWIFRKDERKIYSKFSARLLLDFILFYLIVGFINNNKPFIYFDF